MRPFFQMGARTLVPLESQVFPVIIDGRMSIAQMVEATGCPYNDPEIPNVQYEPKFADKVIERRLRLVPFKKDVSDKDALALVTNDQGHTPTYEDGLAFSTKYPDVQRKVPIPVLDTEGPILGRLRHALILNADDLKRKLNLNWLDNGNDWVGFYWGLALCNILRE